MEISITNSAGSKIPLKDLFSELSYGSYAANRGYGMSHESLLSIGIGNDKMKERYEAENNKNQGEVKTNS